MTESREGKLAVYEMRTPATIKPATELTINDCLIGKPISMMIDKYGHEVAQFIDGQIFDAAEVMDIDVSDRRRMLLTDDILALFPHETLEDIAMAIKNVRHGKYQVYNKLNMEAIRMAMEDQLYAKAAARESSMVSVDDGKVHDFTDRKGYLKAVKKGKEISDQIEQIAKDRTKRLLAQVGDLNIPNESDFPKTSKRKKST